MPVVMSATGGADLMGGPSGSPVCPMRPPVAWRMRSMPGFCARGRREPAGAVGVADAVAAARLLHLDDVGAEVAEERRAPGTGGLMAQVDHADARERRAAVTRAAHQYSSLALISILRSRSLARRLAGCLARRQQRAELAGFAALASPSVWKSCFLFAPRNGVHTPFLPAAGARQLLPLRASRNGQVALGADHPAHRSPPRPARSGAAPRHRPPS